MCRCPKCGRYMNSYMEYIFGGARLVWTCSCGYSTRKCNTVVSDRSFVVKDNKVVTTNHT